LTKAEGKNHFDLQPAEEIRRYCNVPERLLTLSRSAFPRGGAAPLWEDSPAPLFSRGKPG
jgi:hypothetical protein